MWYQIIQTQTNKIIDDSFKWSNNFFFRLFVRAHHCFIVRNLSRVRQMRERSITCVQQSGSRAQTETSNQSATFLNHLNALRQPRNMKTRRLAQAEDDPEMHKTAKLASVWRDLWNNVTTAKDENGELLSANFMSLPSKRKLPEYYQRIGDPIDLISIEQNIGTGSYRTAESFDGDMVRVFVNAVKFFGRTSEPGIAATRLKKLYAEAKLASLDKLQDVLGQKVPPSFTSNKKRGMYNYLRKCARFFYNVMKLLDNSFLPG